MFAISRGELRAPALVLDLNDADATRTIIDTAGYATAYCVSRRDGWPTSMTFVDVSRDEEIDTTELWRLCVECSPGSEPSSGQAFPIDLTVVICSRSRVEGLRTTLQSLSTQTDSEFGVLVIDNSAEGDLAKEFRPEDRCGLTIRLVHEPAPGLSRARNRALAELQTAFVAWIDDDEIADPTWIEWIKRGFSAPDRPDIVSGLMLPAELATQAQANFERYGGFNKGRGIQVARLRAGTPTVSNSIYPLPNFGAGGNMAFRTDLLRDLGGFEPRLGAGTLTHGGEETLVLSRSLDRGATILHWPPAITWHYHRRTDEALEKQFFGYSAGLSAFYMSLVFISPRYIWRIAMLVPKGLADLFLRSRADERSDDPLPDDFPGYLIRASRRGLLQGGWLYLRERARQRAGDSAARR